MLKKLTIDFIATRVKSDRIENIKSINFWGNDLDDVSILKQMPNLEVISLSVNKIRTLSDFGSLKKLRELYLRKNLISDINEIKHLATCPNLLILWINENPIVECKNYRLLIISFLPQLTKLDDNMITPEEKIQANNLNKIQNNNQEDKDEDSFENMEYGGNNYFKEEENNFEVQNFENNPISQNIKGISNQIQNKENERNASAKNRDFIDNEININKNSNINVNASLEFQRKSSNKIDNKILNNNINEKNKNFFKDNETNKSIERERENSGKNNNKAIIQHTNNSIKNVNYSYNKNVEENNFNNNIRGISQFEEENNMIDNKKFEKMKLQERKSESLINPYTKSISKMVTNDQDRYSYNNESVKNDDQRKSIKISNKKFNKNSLQVSQSLNPNHKTYENGYSTNPNIVNSIFLLMKELCVEDLVTIRAQLDKNLNQY